MPSTHMGSAAVAGPEGPPTSAGLVRGTFFVVRGHQNSAGGSWRRARARPRMAPASDESPSEKRQCCAHARPGCGGGGCAHLDEHRRAGGARAVDAICRYMRALANRTPSCAPAGADGVSDATGAHTPAFSHQSLPPRRCALCAPGRTGRRVHACLHCVFLGCRAPAGGGGGCCAAGGGGVPSACASTRMGRSGAALAAAAPSGTLSASVAPAGGHLAAHVRETSGTHALALDLDSGEVWCAACADYVYDPLYSAIVACARARARACRAAARCHAEDGPVRCHSGDGAPRRAAPRCDGWVGTGTGTGMGTGTERTRTGTEQTGTERTGTGRTGTDTRTERTGTGRTGTGTERTGTGTGTGRTGASRCRAI